MTGEANIAARISREPTVRSVSIQTLTAHHRLLLVLCAIFMVASGFSALVYQVTWVRLLGLGLGSTSASISIVVSSFFLGMSLGSYFFERALRLGRDAMATYAGLEICIGVAGLLLLPVLLNLDYVLSFAPAFGTHPVLKLVTTVLLLIVPTTCMGATFPVMAALLAASDRKLGHLISRLYSLNTLGAVLGAALAGFLLIPNWGLDGSIYIAVGVNLAIGAVAFLIARPHYLAICAASTPVESDDAVAGETAPYRWHAAATATLVVTGFASIATQVGWTKYLSIFVGSTITGLSVILAVFLTGIALGAWMIRKRIDTMRSPEMTMAAGLLVAAVTMLIARAGLGFVPEIQAFLNRADTASGTATAIRYGAVILLVLPPTLIFGALFPLNLKIFCGGLTGVKTLIGRAYAVNTVASIAGAAFAGFVVIPRFGSDALLAAMAVLTAASSLLWMKRSPGFSSRLVLATAGAAAIALAGVMPGIDYRQLISTVGYDYYSRTGGTPEFLFLREGKAGVISLVTYDGDQVKLQNNGLNEAQLSQSNSNDVPIIETLLGFIPYALHKDPKSAFVIGFGGGTTTRTFADTDLREIRVVELEPAVVEAGYFVKDGPVSALSDPRVSISYNDARNVLVVEDNKYDIIVSQPSHPWVAGSAGLFSREFWEITRSRLNKGGIFGQWVNLFRMDAPTMKSLFKSFFEVYPNGMIFADSGNMLMIGSEEKLTIDHARFNKLLAGPVLQAKLASSNVRDVNDILWYFALSREEAVDASSDAQASTDANVLSEVRLARLADTPTGDKSPAALMQQYASMDVSSYLGDDPSAKLTLLSMYFLKEQAYDKAGLAIDQLASFDSRRARVLRHRRALDMLDYATATNLYESNSDWPAESHLAQAEAMIEIGDYKEARAAMALAKSAEDSKRESEYLDYLAGVRPDLTKPIPDDGSEWLLMSRTLAGDKLAEARLDQFAAGKSDLPIETQVQLNRILARQSVLHNDYKGLQTSSVALAEATQELVERLATIADNALYAEHARFAELAIKRIEALDANSDKLAEIKSRLTELDG